MEKLSMRGEKEAAAKERARQRIFAVRRLHENEDARMREQAERAIRRVFSEWGEREGGRLPKIPTAVEELVRFYCLDYDRRQKALEERERMHGESTRSSAKKSEKEDMPYGNTLFVSDNQTLHTDDTEILVTHRQKKRCAEGGHGDHHLRVSRKSAGKNSLCAPTAAHYRRINMLIDLSLSLACDEGVRAPMRHDIAERRGDRRTALYYVDRRAYLRQKRMAKLAIAASLGLL